SFSPSKREELLQKALHKLTRWQAYTAQAVLRPAGPVRECIAPLPQDRRFTDPAWQHWPFNVLAQGFLLQQQWWHSATTGVRGTSKHHEEVVTFIVRQWLDMLAPSNFIATNPLAMAETLRRGGANLVHGAAAALADWQRAQRSPDASHRRFQPGRD